MFNFEKDTFKEIGSCEGGVWLLVSDGCVDACVFHCVLSNSFLVIIEIDVFCKALNL